MNIRLLLQLLALASVLTLTARYTFTRAVTPANAAGATRFTGPINSQPLALSGDGSLLAVANPDNNSVSLFDTRPGYNNAKLREITVGQEPNGVALSPDGTRLYVANTVSGTVSVIATDAASNIYGTTVTNIPVGTEPYALALTPQGRKLYVANARSNSVSVIDTNTNQVIRTITNVGPEPRGLAITNDGAGEDAAQTVYVTQFLSLPIAGKVDGQDDAKAGHVVSISTSTDTVTADIVIHPIADTGFKAAGDALQRIAPPATPVAEDFKFVTGAYPNQLNNIALRGHFAFIPNTGASPNGPTRFDVNTQSLLSVVDLTTRTDAGKTINMHQAVARQTATPKRFLTQPWAIAFKHAADEAYVVASASNVVVKLKIDPATGAPTVQSDAADGNRVVEIATGKNPRGIVISPDDKTAYVMNYVSRDLTVIDLSGAIEKVAATVSSASLPTAGTPEDVVHIGKELYFTSVGQFDPPAAGQPAITGRMSNNGWGSCSGCHPFGLSDNVVWLFASGPRRTIPQHADFANGDPTTIKALNWSAFFDEEEDFESNIRGISGGQGLLVLEDGVTQDPALGNFTPASGGRRQLKVRGVNAWDAIRTFVAKGIRSPISPVSKTDPDVIAGRELFTQANCQSCHGGPQWTTSKVRYTAPPDPSLIDNVQILTELRSVSTFDAAALNEVRQNAAAPLGAQGFNPPTLLSLFAFPQTFFHNGSVDSLDAVMANVAHRSAGTGTDMLQSATQRAQLIKFLLSIDGATQPINPAPPGSLQVISAASYTGTEVAPESAAAAFGQKLAAQIVSSPTAALTTALGGTTAAVKDAAGVLRLSRLYFVSPGQVNLEVPGTVAEGPATFTIFANSGATSTGTANIRNVSPGIFTADGSGRGVAAALASRYAQDGTVTPVPVFQCAGSGCTTAAIDLGAATDRVFVSLYGTGLRKVSGLAGVKATVGGVAVPVSFAGAQGTIGLDQVNIELPRSLIGYGEVPVVMTVDGVAANTVLLRIK